MHAKRRTYNSRRKGGNKALRCGNRTVKKKGNTKTEGEVGGGTFLSMVQERKKGKKRFLEKSLKKGGDAEEGDTLWKRGMRGGKGACSRRKDN